MTRIWTVLLATFCLAVTANAASPPDPAGDWVGPLRMPGHVYQLGLRVRHAPAGYQATYDWISLELRNIPLVPLGGQTTPAFERTAIQGVFVARWAPAQGWLGEWRRGGHVYAMTFRPGALPPAPLVSRLDQVILAVLAAVMLLEAVAIAWLLRVRRRRELRAKPSQ